MKTNKLIPVILLLYVLSIFLYSCSNSVTFNENFFKTLPVEKQNPLPDDALPDFNDYFAPEGVKTDISVPGGNMLPIIGSTAAANTPMISEFSDLTYEDETLAIIGENLTDSTLLVWAEEIFTEVKPLRTDNTKMQVTLPKGVGKSMMIIWPKNDNGIGSPVRVNAPEIWWLDKELIYKGSTETEICIYGSGLAFDDTIPTVLAVYSDGREELLKVLDFNTYQIKVSYPKSLKANSYCKIYVHNGTGGKYGWSDAQILEVKKNYMPSQKKLKKFYVDSYGAFADDGKDDVQAIYKALADAKAHGGGIIEFGQGEYNISTSIKIDNSYQNGLIIQGVGMGEFDSAISLSPNEYDERGVSGKYTIIRFMNEHSVINDMIKIEADYITLRDLTVNGYDGTGANTTLLIKGDNITVSGVRLVKSDLRDFSDGTDLSVSTNLLIEYGSKNISVIECDFRSRQSAIKIGTDGGDYSGGYFDETKKTRNVRVLNCNFVGYTSSYTHPSGIKGGDDGEGSRGISILNLDGGVIENNTFQGYDRKNQKLLVRSIYCGLSTRRTYIADNTIKNVGNYPGTGFDTNTGEQILFHGNDNLSSSFEIVKTEGLKLTVNIGEEGFIPKGFDKGYYGSLFVTAGNGAGQVRSVTEYEQNDSQIVFILEEPFAINPEFGGTVTLTAPFTENIVYNNTIANDEPTLFEGLKTGGVLFFFQSYNNIIANNNIENMSFGIVLNTTYNMPTYWTTVRDNRLSGITEAYKDAMQGGDTTLNATFLCDSVRMSKAYNNEQYIHAIGNVFRNNDCQNGDTAGEIHSNRWHIFDEGMDEFFGGCVMTIFENNSFKNVSQGIGIGNPAYWTLIRNNNFSFTDKSGYLAEEILNLNLWTNFKLLYIKDNVIIRDDNRTVTK